MSISRLLGGPTALARGGTRTWHWACPQLGYAGNVHELSGRECCHDAFGAQAGVKDRRIRRRGRSVRAIAASRLDQLGRRGRRRATGLIRPRPEILLVGAAGSAFAMNDFRSRTSE